MPTLQSLIDEVEATAPSPAPLDQLATASATAQTVDELTDSMLSHFVDKCRRSGHSWAEIGTALGVSKQAVQKRFTNLTMEPTLSERYTPRARRLVEVHAPAAAEELGHDWIGTEHLLLGFYAEPEALAPKILAGFGLDRARALAGVRARARSEAPGIGPLTPRAWAAIATSTREAVQLGHNYVGTEHQLLALLSVGGTAAEILAEAGITRDAAREKVITMLLELISQQPK
jgi:ATP-dependent Clp protease ATP-binding subunit ClpA